jgi:hypothetical protein
MRARFRTILRLGVRSMATTGLCLVAGGFLMGTGGLNEIELSCEEAVAKLTDCCPSLRIESGWCYESSGCNEQHPWLSVDESDCILQTDCDAIVAHDVCYRLEHKHDYAPDASSSQPQGGKVCP